MAGIAVFAALAVATGVAKAEMMSKVGPGEGEVAIVAWPGYIERGDTDKNYDWVTDFEKQTGCKVTAKTAGSSDEMVALMNAGGFDLVTASGDATLRLIAGGKVQQINTNLIPSWNTIDKRLQNGAWHTVGGKHFGVPYQWGPNVLMYNTTVFKEAPKSWDVVFTEQKLPDGKSNQGRVEAYYGPIYIADAALYLMDNKPELGIQDPYALTKPQFDAAIDLLRQQRQIVNKYWGDAAAQAGSRVAAIPAVRAVLRDVQHRFAASPPGAVLDGRDIGTVVFPEAPVKLYIDAPVAGRARRRHKELIERGLKSIYSRVLQEMKERDARDRGRKVAPLAAAKDALVIDSSKLDADAVFSRAVAYIDRILPNLGPGSSRA